MEDHTKFLIKNYTSLSIDKLYLLWKKI